MNKEQTLGTAEILFSYVCWGFLTLFWGLLSHVHPVYVLAQRIFWSMGLLFVVILATQRFALLRAAFVTGSVMRICLLSGLLISLNWGLYIYAVSSGHVLDASLGYFVQPLLVGLIGIFFFKESLSFWDKGAYLLSFLGLLCMIFYTRAIPLFTILIASTFAVYGAVKNSLPTDPIVSLFLETLCVTPLALPFIIWMELSHKGSLGILHGSQFLLLPLCGLVTSVPLLVYSSGIKKVPYYLSGILMYLNPTIQFLIGIFHYRESPSFGEKISFSLIWLGILLSVWGKLKLRKQG
ncbi:EamA family transporter RarD [Clostridiaceae bacterium 68-1-5]|uniref:EamA family transporter RarD n=1 Tax=Suipraeoptans intestinalis TaxID=2606628 RepID=A0A6N7UTX8_9FIRM|nr:EamA family transporter RarD [Suipraeoptans intestinalis]MSR94724.1 EamA family transporter RarD [Suipraeoptans intestinalis]